jgi:MFS family permease
VTRSGRDRGVAILLGVVFLFPIVQLGAAPALTDIGTRLQLGPGQTVWVMSAFLLSGAVCAPLIGSLGDVVGRRRMLVITMAVVAAGSLVGSVSNELWQLVAGRALQGAVAGVFPLAFSIARDIVPAVRQTLVIGLLTAVAGVGAGVAMLLGGLATDALTYRAVFGVDLVGALAALSGALLLPTPPTTRLSRGRVDLGGAVLLAASVLPLMLAITELGDWVSEPVRAVALLGSGAVLLVVLVAVEHRVRAPLLDLRILAQPALLVINAASLLVNIGGFAVFVLVPQFAQSDPASTGFGFGSSASQVGVALLPAAVLTIGAGPLLGRLGLRIGHHRAQACAAGLVALGMAGLAFGPASPVEFFVLGGCALMGLNLCFTAMTNAIVEQVPSHHVGAATGTNSLVRTVGNAFGAQSSAGILVAFQLPTTRVTTLAGFRSAFLVCAVAAAAGALLALAVPGPSPAAEASAATEP